MGFGKGHEETSDRQKILQATVGAAEWAARTEVELEGPQTNREKQDESNEEHVALPEQPTSWFSRRGTARIFVFKFTRFLTLAALFALSVASASKVGWTWYNIALVLTAVSIFASSCCVH